MKLSCDTAQLRQAIQNVSLAVSQKSTLPALEGILVTAKADQLTLVGYNLELGITTSIDVELSEPGEVVIPARLFSEIIRKIESDRVAISCDSRFLVEITGGVSQFTILGMSAFEFPELPAVSDGHYVTLPQNTLRSMVDQVLFAVATSDAKPVHTGALFEFEPDEVTIVAVDGFRLALRREPAKSEESIRFVVPGKSLSDLLKLLSEEDEPVELQVSKKHIVFSVGRCNVISRLLEGDFLDYHAAVPKESGTEIKINTRSFLSAIERTSLLISDVLKSPLKVTFDEGLIKMSCSTTIGKAYDECRCEFSGKPVEMGFNNRYLIDALKNSGTDQIRLQISGPLAPMKVVPVQGDSFLFLVLPMKLKNE